MFRTSHVSTLSAAIVTAIGSIMPPQAQQEGASRIKEVVVTARRREESLQDIPLAVTAFGTADMEARNIENTADLNVLLPNVVCV